MEADAPGAHKNPAIGRILLRIRQLTRGIDQQSRLLIRDWGVTVPQLLCLQAVADEGPLTVGHLAQRVNLSGSTISGIVERLEKRGLFYRDRSSQDRRVVHLTLTPSATALLDRAPRLLQEHFTDRLTSLPPEKLLEIVSTLDFLATLLEVEGLEVEPLADPNQTYEPDVEER